MLASAQSLDAPKTGRSRFSKALPAPPPGLASVTAPNERTPRYAMPPSMAAVAEMLPSAPAPPPKQQEQDASSPTKPLNSPLPPLPLPLPLLKRKAPPPAPMAIPRRPVGNPSAGGGSSSSSSASPAGAVPPAEKSPALSISSLLSAYSRTSEESVVRSSEGTASTKTSYIAASPSQETTLSFLKRDSIFTPLSLSSFDDESQQQKPAQPQRTTPVDDKPDPPPRHPVRDQSRRQPWPSQAPATTPTAQTPEARSSSSTSSTPTPTPTNTSPSDLLRRREQKADKNLALPELRLPVSHGSSAQSQQSETAAAAPPPPPPASISPLFPPQPAFAREPTEVAPQRIPRSAPLGLPGRNIRPVASQEAAPQPAGNMGSVASKIERKVEAMAAKKEAKNHSPLATSGSTGPKPDEAPTSPIKRLPTPEYEKHDVQKPLVERVVSPASPASSPDLRSQEKHGEKQKEKEVAKVPSITRKAIGLPSNVRPVKSNSPPAPPPPSKSPEQRQQPPKIEAQLPSQPSLPPKDYTPSRVVPAPAEANPFPTRTTSRPTEQPAAPFPRREPAAQPILPTTSQRSIPAPSPPLPDESSKHSLETLRPTRVARAAEPSSSSNFSPTDDDASAAVDNPAFPLAYATPAPPGTVFPAPPLAAKHFECYQGHRTMARDKNFNCPLACQACLRRDAEARFKCRWCYLRICQGCLDVFVEGGRDLRYLLERCGGGGRDEEGRRTPTEETPGFGAGGNGNALGLPPLAGVGSYGL